MPGYNQYEEPFQPRRNAFDTFLRGEDEMARRMRPVYGSPPNGVSSNEVAAEDAARRFARRRLLMSLQGGLGAGVEAGGGFFGNLLRGASGSLGGTLQANQMQHEEERQSIRDAAEQRRYEEQNQRLMESLRVSQGHLKVSQDRELRESQPQPEASDLPSLLRVPEDKWSTFLSRSGDVARATRGPERPEREKLIQVAGPDGSPMYVPESQAIGKKLPRERSLIKGQERTSLGFYNRAKDASEAMLPLEEEIAGLALPDQFRLRFAPNLVQTPSMQLYRQAQRAFSEARLRRESGAVITQHELDSDSKTYFAQPGDSPKTVERKRQARQKVLDALKFQSGNAYEEFYGEPNTSPGQDTEDDPLGVR